MHPRVRLGILTGVSLVLAAVLVAVVTADPGRQAEPGFRGATSAPGQPPADFSLRDQDGRTVRAPAFRGRPVVLTFLYTTCQDTCPTTAQQIRGALDQLGAGVPALAVAVDPPRDTPLRARQFLAKQSLTGRMRFLLGPRAELERVWRSYGVQPQRDGLDHSARVVLLGRDGRPAVAWPVDQLTPEGLAHDLRLLLDPPRPA